MAKRKVKNGEQHDGEPTLTEQVLARIFDIYVLLNAIELAQPPSVEPWETPGAEEAQAYAAKLLAAGKLAVHDGDVAIPLSKSLTRQATAFGIDAFRRQVGIAAWSLAYAQAENEIKGLLAGRTITVQAIHAPWAVEGSDVRPSEQGAVQSIPAQPFNTYLPSSAEIVAGSGYHTNHIRLFDLAYGTKPLVDILVE